MEKTEYYKFLSSIETDRIKELNEIVFYAEKMNDIHRRIKLGKADRKELEDYVEYINACGKEANELLMEEVDKLLGKIVETYGNTNYKINLTDKGKVYVIFIEEDDFQYGYHNEASKMITIFNSIAEFKEYFKLPAW